MVTKEIFRSIPGIFCPFKEYLQSLKLADGDQIAYYGCVGTCSPFVELLAMTLRGLHLEHVFVPLLDESKAKKLVEIPDVGMQVSGGCPAAPPGDRDYGWAGYAESAASKRGCAGTDSATWPGYGCWCLFQEHV